MKSKYSLTSKTTDPVVHLRMPKALFEDLTSRAKSNARLLQTEIYARLARTLENNDEMMGHDRLLRLIFSKKLAYKGKVKKAKIG